MNDMVSELITKAICDLFRAKHEHIMLAVQSKLDTECSVQTRPMINPKFLAAHPVADQPFDRLLDVVVDAVKTSISKPRSR